MRKVLKKTVCVDSSEIDFTGQRINNKTKINLMRSHNTNTLLVCTEISVNRQWWTTSANGCATMFEVYELIDGKAVKVKSYQRVQY